MKKVAALRALVAFFRSEAQTSTVTVALTTSLSHEGGQRTTHHYVIGAVFCRSGKNIHVIMDLSNATRAPRDQHRADDAQVAG